MKAAVLVCLLALSLGNPIVNDVVDLFEVAEGLLEGFATGLDAGNVVTCVDNITESASSILRAIETMFNDDLYGGLEILKAAGEHMIISYGLCSSAYDQYNDVMENEIAVWNNPFSFLYTIGRNLVLTGGQIVAEVSYAIGFYHSGNWKGFGFNLGEAFGKLLIDSDPPQGMI